MNDHPFFQIFIIIFTCTLAACSHSVGVTLIGDDQTARIESADILENLPPAHFLTSVERKNSRNAEGFYVYYLKSEDKISEIVKRNDMHALFYKIVECDNPNVEIYSDMTYRLKRAPMNLSENPRYQYFAAYIPKKYPYFFRLLNRSTGQEFKPSYNNLNAQCLRLNAGGMSGSNLKSNLISLDLKKEKDFD